MRWISALLLFLTLTACEKDYNNSAASGPLIIYGTTDTSVFNPVIDDFLRLNPDIAIEYEELEAGPLYDRFLEEERIHKPRADLLLSSAMDLQVKLVNDGFAAVHQSNNAAQLPSWARWRNEAFGFTFEPVVMVYNRRIMEGRDIPQTRSQLLADLRADQPFWQDRIGTYDVVESHVGYFIASQDARYSSDFGALVEAFRVTGAKRRRTTASLLDEIAAGKLVLGYNLLGSYAQAKAKSSKMLLVVKPKDYTLAVSRTAVIPKSAPHAEAAHQFLEYLLSTRGQQALTDKSNLNSIRESANQVTTEELTKTDRVGTIRPIPLGPGLLVYLDQQKHGRMLELFGITNVNGASLPTN